jgi:hypothetical protein
MTSHLDDAAFAELWTNALAEGRETADHPHLHGCAECRVRFASFSAWMNEIRSDAADSAAEALTPERLASQQSVIFRRLEALERPARVIVFPKSGDGTSRRSPVRRWITAAAAAGLIAGIGLGQMVNIRLWSPLSTQVRTTRTAEPISVPDGRGPVALPAVATISDEATLAEFEAIATPRYEALQAYDTFTPRAADFVQPR